MRNVYVMSTHVQYISAYDNIYVCIYVYICMYVCMYIYVCIYVYICMYVCIIILCIDIICVYDMYNFMCMIYTRSFSGVFLELLFYKLS